MGDESGATSIEYALIGSLISIAILFGASALGVQLGVLYDAIATKIIEATS